MFFRKAVKATLVLLPLLGITYMLFFVNPGEDEVSQIVFIYFNSFLESFQVRHSQSFEPLGLQVVTMFCTKHTAAFTIQSTHSMKQS